MKTLDQVKEDYARKKGYKSYSDMMSHFVNNSSYSRVENAFTDIAHQYAQYMCEQQRIICADHALLHIARNGSEDIIRCAHKDYALGYYITPFHPSILEAPLATPSSTNTNN